MKRLIAVLLSALLAMPAQAETAPPTGPQTGPETTPPDRVTLMLDWFVNPNHAPIILAQELGHFQAAGLEVDILTPSDPNAPPRMAAAGEVDLALSYQPELHLSRHDGLPLRRVGTLIATPLTCLAVLAEGPVQGLADLRGQKVGFAVAGVQEILLEAMLAHHGLTRSDVEAVNIGWSISPALMSGQVAGVIGAFRNFELNQMQIEGVKGRCFLPEEEGVPAYDELIYVANPDRMNPDVLARFLKATALAAQEIQASPEMAWQRFSATSPELQTDLNRLAWADTWSRFSAQPAALDAGRYAAFETFLAERGATPGGLPVEALAVDLTANVTGTVTGARP